MHKHPIFPDFLVFLSTSQFQGNLLYFTFKVDSRDCIELQSKILSALIRILIKIDQLSSERNFVFSRASYAAKSRYNRHDSCNLRWKTRKSCHRNHCTTVLLKTELLIIRWLPVHLWEIPREYSSSIVQSSKCSENYVPRESCANVSGTCKHHEPTVLNMIDFVSVSKLHGSRATIISFGGVYLTSSIGKVNCATKSLLFTHPWVNNSTLPIHSTKPPRILLSTKLTLSAVQ